MASIVTFVIIIYEKSYYLFIHMLIFRSYHYTQNLAGLNSGMEAMGLDSHKPTPCVTPMERTTLPNGTPTHDSRKLIICHYFTAEPHVQWITWQYSCRIYKETRLIDFNRLPVCHAHITDKGSENWVVWLTRFWLQYEKGTKNKTQKSINPLICLYMMNEKLGSNVEK
jgi:hypothetical protein